LEAFFEINPKDPFGQLWIGGDDLSDENLAEKCVRLRTDPDLPDLRVTAQIILHLGHVHIVAPDTHIVGLSPGETEPERIFSQQLHAITGIEPVALFRKSTQERGGEEEPPLRHSKERGLSSGDLKHIGSGGEESPGLRGRIDVSDRKSVV